jgi:chemotaxis signal transduction protein
MGASGKYLVLAAGESSYALSLEQVAEIAEPQPLSLVPRGPDWCAGAMVAQSGVVAVMDLARYMGEEPNGASVEKIVVLDCQGGGLAIQANRLDGIVTVEQAELAVDAQGEYLLLSSGRVPVLDACMLVDEAAASMAL